MSHTGESECVIECDSDSAGEYATRTYEILIRNMNYSLFVALFLIFYCSYGDINVDNKANDKKSDIEPNEMLFRGIVANDYDEVKRAIVIGKLLIMIYK